MKRIKIFGGYIVLLIVILFSVGNISFAAQQQGSGSGRWINPHYNLNTVTFEKKLGSITADKKESTTAEYFDRTEEAADYLRTAMVNRQDVISMRIAFDMAKSDEEIFYDDEYFFINEDWVSATVYALFLDACKHTGNGKEGDAIMWCTGGYGYDYVYQVLGNVLYFNLEYEMVYYTDAQQETELDEAVDRVLDELDVYDGNNYEKTVAIYNYICDNVTYDNYHLNRDPYYLPMYTAYAALVDGTAVCQGYSVLFYRLALELGVDARFIGGRTDNEGHAWNIVRLGREYYNLDSTWDAGEDESYYDYFLRGSDFFDTEHYRDPEYLTYEFLNEYPVPTYDFNSAYYNPTDEHIHFFTLKSMVNASCTARGSKVYECVCGYSETEYIEPFGHSFSEYTVTLKPTCISEGTQRAVCGRCNGIDERKIPVTEHTYKAVVVAATCIQRGYTVFTCSYCNNSYKDDYTEKTGHKAVNLSGVLPTCTKTGLTPGMRCTVCSQDIVKQEIIPASGHNAVGKVVSKATYFKKGKTVYKCTVCNEILSEKAVSKRDITEKLDMRTSVIKNNTVTVSWNKIPKADKYIFYYGKDKNNMKKKTVKSTSAQINGFKKGDVYYYKVVALSGKKKSDPGDIYYVIYTPEIPYISSLRTDGKGQFTAKWSKAEGVSGYQISYSLTGKFKKKTTKNLDVKKAKTSKKTIKKLASGKKYFVKVRAYKTVDGKKIYGPYSKVKTVKVK